MDYVKDIIPESSKLPSRLTQSRKKTWGKSWEKASEECHFWPRNVSKMRRGGKQRGAYAASFVTRECLASLVCDPTILISCQS
jgi:hypothetical protein